MKIIRTVNDVPIEIELNAQEEAELFEELYLKRITSNLFLALENEADNDDPDTDDPFAAKNALAALRHSPMLATLVARTFDNFIDDLYDGVEEAECALNAYKYIVKGRII